MKWLLIVIPLVFIIFLFSYAKFNIYFMFNDGNSIFDISTSFLFGLLKPEIQPFDKNKENKSNSKSSQKEKKPPKIIKYYDYEEIIKYLWKRIVFEELKWETKVGITDAFYLSVIYGNIWWFKSLLTSIFLLKKDSENIYINVTPIYNINHLETKFNCIIKIRMVYIINIWIWLIKLYKGGEKNDRSSNRRLNENYND